MCVLLWHIDGIILHLPHICIEKKIQQLFIGHRPKGAQNFCVKYIYIQLKRAKTNFII